MQLPEGDFNDLIVIETGPFLSARVLPVSSSGVINQTHTDHEKTLRS